MSNFYEFIVANIQSFDIVTKFPDPMNGWDVILFKEPSQDGGIVSVLMGEVINGEITNTHTLFTLTANELLALCAQVFKAWGEQDDQNISG